MAFPTVAARADSQTTTGNMNHTVSLPTGIVNGNKLIVAFVCDGQETPGWPAGWTQIAIRSTTGLTTECRERAADGTEGATITVTTTAAAEAGHRSWRITGHHASSPTEGDTSSGAAGTTADPPNLIPSWGADDTLWIAVAGRDINTATISSYPTNYTDGFTGQNGRVISTAERQLNAASEDPGVFTYTGSVLSRNATLAVRPAAGGGPATVTRRALLGVGV
jgi:hypothetical protein